VVGVAALRDVKDLAAALAAVRDPMLRRRVRPVRRRPPHHAL